MRYLVVGAARSGVAAANFLAARGEAVALYDAKPDPDLPYELAGAVARIFGREGEAVLDGVGTIVVSPGVPLSIPLLQIAAKHSIPVISEIELGFRHLKGTVIAITGTNGKSTTTALIGEILRLAGRDPIVAGNIGEPLTASLDPDNARTYVLELSSFQLETVDQFHARVALLLNITPDHLDRYADMDAYAAAKHRVFRNQESSDVAIVNASDPRSLSASRARLWRFSSSESVETGACIDGEDLVMRIDGDERRIARSVLRLEGQANVENALAAWLAARAVSVDDEHVRIAFGTFAGLPHRMVLVRELDGVRWINDSKGTNVDATFKSLQGFHPSSVVLILGGKDKAGQFEQLRPLVEQRVRAVLTIGSASQRITSALDGAAEIVPAGDMATAIRWARQNALAGDTVLLSPACASFDQYRNFEHRGQHFEELVRSL